MAILAVLVVTTSRHPDAATCAHPRRTDGIDVSSFQGTIDWSRVARTCIGFAYIRVAVGTTPDPTYGTNAAGARSEGLAVGAYQYFHPDEDASAQARLFISSSGYRPGDLAPVLDVEMSGGVSRAVVLAGIRTWLTSVEAGLGVRPMIYTNPSFWTTRVHSPALTRYPLWIANYTTAAKPDVPQDDWGGHGWTVWQYDPHGRIAGIGRSVDLDRAAA
ncbi:MAG: glycosyl hydrolase family 25 [Actinobacteria bacterium]|nr:glycosyl hydrolase family 25 [Actinomycetota bacterium]